MMKYYKLSCAFVVCLTIATQLNAQSTDKTVVDMKGNRITISQAVDNAENGLNLNTATKRIELGGTLTKPTLLNLGANSLTLNANGTGKLIYTDGSQGLNKVLTSDANGLASWKIPATQTATGPAGGDLTGTYPNPIIADNAVTSAKIIDGTIVNADISNTADIAVNKLNGTATAGQVLTSNGTTTAWSDVLEPFKIQNSVTNATLFTQNIYTKGQLALGDFSASAMPASEKLRIEDGELTLKAEGTKFPDFYPEYYSQLPAGMAAIQNTYNQSGSSTFHFRKARGTKIAPAQTQPKDLLGSLQFHGRSATNTWENNFTINIYKGATTNSGYIRFGTIGKVALEITEQNVPRIIGAVGFNTDVPIGVGLDENPDDITDYGYMLVAKNTNTTKDPTNAKSGSIGVVARNDRELISAGTTNTAFNSEVVVLTEDKIKTANIIVVYGGGQYTLPPPNGTLAGRKVRFYLVGNTTPGGGLDQLFTISTTNNNEFYKANTDVNPNPELIDTWTNNTITFKQVMKRTYNMLSFYCSGDKWLFDAN